MSIITLTSDFGLLDYRVASIKGAILSISQNINIVDITHQIDSYNLLQTAYIVRNAYKNFPKKSVHIISVDSLYRREVKPLIYSVDEHYFIAADNGVMSLIFHDIKPEAVYEIIVNNRFDDVVNFPSVDIFAPAAVHLCNGGLPEVIGRAFAEPKEVIMPRAVYNPTEKMLIGEVIYIDNFGNVVANISKKLFQKTLAGFSSYQIRFRNMKLSKIYGYYTEFISDWSQERDYHGKALSIFNDNDLLEICIYKGVKNNGARTLFGLSVGEKIYVEFFD